MLPTSAGVEPATSWSPVGRASNWATEAGETQLVMLVEDMSRNAIQGRQTDPILLDFSKAFDKVSHEKLLYTQSAFYVNLYRAVIGPSG